MATNPATTRVCATFLNYNCQRLEYSGYAEKVQDDFRVKIKKKFVLFRGKNYSIVYGEKQSLKKYD